LVGLALIPSTAYFFRHAGGASSPFKTFYLVLGWVSVAALVLLLSEALVDVRYNTEDEEQVHLRTDSETAIGWAKVVLGKLVDAPGARWISLRKPNVLGIRTGPASPRSRQPRPSVVTVRVTTETDETIAIVRSLTTSRSSSSKTRNRRNVEAVAAGLRALNEARGEP